jgi:hypothetical protein
MPRGIEMSVSWISGRERGGVGGGESLPQGMKLIVREVGHPPPSEAKG